MRDIKVGRQCIGSGQCEMLAPAVFQVGDDSRAHVRADVHWTASLEDAVDEAVLSCPTNALEDLT